MTLYETLKQIGLPVAYSFFKEEQEPPYLIYTGDGQDQFQADNTYYTAQNRYQIEYYYTRKDEQKESEIETFLLGNGYRYTKSEDVYLDDQNIFVIYYDI